MPSRRVVAGVLALVAILSVTVPSMSAQPVNIEVSGDVLRVRAQGLRLLDGEPLARLKDGRTVRVEVALEILAAREGAAVTTVRHTCAFSYDLWEERFAVSTPDAPADANSHATSAAAESWCLGRVDVPLASLRRLGAGASFWIRLGYRILDDDAQRDADEGAGFTLQALIDALSRRRAEDRRSEVLVAGPFRVPPKGGLSPPTR